MITLPEELKAILAAGADETFYTARIWHRGSSTNIWAGTTYHSSINLDGVAYSDELPILKIDNVQLVSSVDRSLFSITVGNTNLLSGDLSSTGLVGKLLEVRLWFIDPSSDLPISYSIVAYKGLIDSVGFDISEEAEALVIGAASPVNDLGMKKFIYLTKDIVRKRNPNDSSCDVITRGSVQASLNWGKSKPDEGVV
jgi:hypothetical protein